MYLCSLANLRFFVLLFYEVESSSVVLKAKIIHLYAGLTVVLAGEYDAQATFHKMQDDLEGCRLTGAGVPSG